MALSHIEVSDYGNKVFERTWAARTRGMWGSAAVGLLAGGTIGAIAPFFPVIAGVDAALAVAQIPSSMAILGATGMTSGFAVGAIVGATSGAATAAAREQERRMRERDLALGLTTPEQELAISQQVAAQPDERGIFQRFAEGINLKAGVMFTTLGIIGGLVLSAAFHAIGGGVGSPTVPGLSTLLGPAISNPAAVTAYFAGVMGSFGALFGAYFPATTAHAQAVAGGMLKGKNPTLGTVEGPQSHLTVLLAHETELEQATAALERVSERNRTFQDMLAAKVSETEQRIHR